MFRRFLDAADYWFGYSDDSSAGSYDHARECCVVIANDPANAADVVGAGDGEVPPALGTRPRLAAGPSAPSPSPPRGADINAQLAQARELEAKLAEEYRTVRLLRASIAGEASARGEHARELGRQARDRINTNFNVDNPPVGERAGRWGAQGPEPSVHAGGAAEHAANPGRTPAKDRLLDTRGQARDGDTCNVINAR
jgi:hypothetical protein